MALTKAGLARQVYEQHKGLTRPQSLEYVEAFLRISKDSLIGGSDLMLSRFGKFCIKEKSSRRGRNPMTGAKLILDSKRVVTFKLSRVLRARINGS